MKLKHAVDCGEISWDTRVMMRMRPNVHPGDILMFAFGKSAGRLMLVVHATESSAKLVEVTGTQIEDDSHTFSEAERGEYVSSHLSYNEQGGGIKLVARIPLARIKCRLSTLSEQKEPLGFVYVPIARHNPNVKTKVKTAVAAVAPIRSTIDDDFDQGSRCIRHIQRAAVSAAEEITATGPGS